MAVFGDLYRKIAKIQTLIFHAISFFEPLGDPFGLKIGMGVHLHESDAIAIQILDFLIFWSFLGLFILKFWPFSGFRPKIPDKNAEKRPKTQKLKNLNGNCIRLM